MNVFLGTYWEVLDAARETVGIDLVVVEDKPTAARAAEHARRCGIPVAVLAQGARLSDIFPSSVDLAVVGSFGRILRMPVIGRCKAVLNVHPGIVEVCRGRHTLPVNVLRGDPMMGITFHLIESEEIDAGPIVAQIRLPIDYDADFDANHARLRRALEPMARLVLAEYASRGVFPAWAWTPTPDSYHPPLPPETFRTVLEAGRLADCVRMPVDRTP